MSIAELLLIGIGLSMDALAVAICKGLSMQKQRLKGAVIVGLYFGIFQALMPLIGYLVGSQFAAQITAFDHWIAFILLGFIGGKMIKDSFGKDEGDDDNQSISFKTMLPMAIATSIDALAVGISFAFLSVDIVPAVSLIGLTTFAISVAGVLLGKLLGKKFKARAELLGGIVLVLIGVKILVEHLFF